MRLLLNIILISLAVMACYLEDLYIYFWPPQPYKPLYLTIRSRLAYNFNQQEALAASRQKALSLHVPVYRYIPPKIQASRDKFRDFERAVAALQTKEQNRTEGLRLQLQKDFGVELSPTDIISIVKYRDFKNLLEGILTIEESIQQNKILADSLHLARHESIEIHGPNNGTVTHPIKDLITIEKARFLMEEKVRQLFWQVDKRVLDPLLRICLTTLHPNLGYDQKENDRRLEEINREFPIRGSFLPTG